MNWIVISVEDVQTRLTGAELAAFQSAAKASGQRDPLPEIIAQVIDEMRGFILACPRNRLAPGSVIPPRLLGTALALIRYRLATRLPAMKSLIDELRVKEYDDAMKTLREVAACHFVIEDPEAQDDDVAASISPMTKPRRHQFSREQQEGV